MEIIKVLDIMESHGDKYVVAGRLLEALQDELLRGKKSIRKRIQ